MDALGLDALEIGRKYGMTQAWMLSARDALEHGRNRDVGMGVVGAGCSGAWMESGCARGCGLNGTQSSMEVVRMWAKILWSWAAVVHELNAGRAMNASRIGWSTDLKKSCYLHGCPGHRTHSSMNYQSVVMDAL